MITIDQNTINDYRVESPIIDEFYNWFYKNRVSKSLEIRINTPGNMKTFSISLLEAFTYPTSSGNTVYTLLIYVESNVLFDAISNLAKEAKLKFGSFE